MSTYNSACDPRVTKVVDLLVDALVGSANDARTSERYIHGDVGIARSHVDAAYDAAKAAQIALQMAIYDLAEGLVDTRTAVAS